LFKVSVYIENKFRTFKLELNVIKLPDQWFSTYLGSQHHAVIKTIDEPVLALK
jgi:hypothetical protein